MTAALRAAVAAVPDPEIRVLSIEDLGILRDVQVEPDGLVVVTITPTYLGCPALEQIKTDIRRAARDAGAQRVSVVVSLSPPWTSDWLTDSAREKLTAAGIAPPRRLLPLVSGRPRCPRCRTEDTTRMTDFGSTSCKALWRCHSCREPFDHFKEH